MASRDQTGAQPPTGSGDETELKAELAKLKQTGLKATSDAEKLEKAESREDVPVEEAESRAKKKGRLAQILQRGFVNDKLVVEGADPEKYYCWVRDEVGEVARMKALGFDMENEAGSGIHGTGDLTRRVGDVVLMSCSRDNYQLIQEIRMEQKSRRSTLGKKEYLRRAKIENPEVPVIDPLNVGT